MSAMVGTERGYPHNGCNIHLAVLSATWRWPAGSCRAMRRAMFSDIRTVPRVKIIYVWCRLNLCTMASQDGSMAFCLCLTSPPERSAASQCVTLPCGRKISQQSWQTWCAHHLHSMMLDIWIWRLLDQFYWSEQGPSLFMESKTYRLQPETLGSMLLLVLQQWGSEWWKPPSFVSIFKQQMFSRNGIPFPLLVH